MKNAIIGYWKICRDEGFLRMFSSFYDYYYSKYKLNKIRQTGNNFVFTHGCKIEVNPNDEGLSAELLVHGSHEPDTTKFISNYLKQNMTCIDIGANIGYYSTLYSKIVKNSGKVISIEPSPVNFKYLKNNLQLQNIKNYQLFNCACGAQENNVKFLLDKRANKCMIIQNEKISSDTSTIVTVPVKKLDDIVLESKVQNVDFIKMDVEGYEWFAIQGSVETIKKFKPTIQIEIHFNKLGIDITKKLLTYFKNENYIIIYHDIQSDRNLFQKKQNLKCSFDDLIMMNIDLRNMNSFKLVIEHKNFNEGNFSQK